ncbi:MAG: hypothetical protein Ta2G_18430 [Termitinemataceae bacterium]|nr:hypothetical protein FACS1894102_6250 [Spirochaetia bacterium]GMO58330.1 MAG: hypothetical protein Ta2G_18430 [Termitinemataceae bacterium]
MGKLLYIFVSISGVFACACAQILLKKSANKHYTGLAIYLNKGTLVGYVIFLLATITSVLAYKHIELSTGVLLESLGYIFVLLLSCMFLKEKIKRGHILGIVLVLSGIAVYALFGGA